MLTQDSEVTRGILARFQWKKIQAPRAWRPKELGEELVGYYGGRTLRNSSFGTGQYEVVLVHVPLHGSFTISGTQLIQLLDAGMVNPGTPVRIRWTGEAPVGKGRQMKTFEVYIAEGDPISAEDMPAVE